MTRITTQKIWMGLALLTVFALVGCGSPDKEMMEQGLVRSGHDAAQAKCLAEEMGDSVKSDIYNFIAKLMNEGMVENEAVSRARRKYGADFKTGLKEARQACVK